MEQEPLLPINRPIVLATLPPRRDIMPPGVQQICHRIKCFNTVMFEDKVVTTMDTFYKRNIVDIFFGKHSSKNPAIFSSVLEMTNLGEGWWLVIQN